MRSALVILTLLAGISGLSAEIWLSREGACGDWRSRWNVEQDESGLWVGSIDHVHVGGPCAQGTGRRIGSDVKAVIAGESFFAARRDDNGHFCSYYGRIREDRVRGPELCAGTASQSTFALRFPPQGNSEARQRHERRPIEREDDDWLDNPQTLDRTRPPPDFNLEFRGGPRQ